MSAPRLRTLRDTMRAPAAATALLLAAGMLFGMDQLIVRLAHERILARSRSVANLAASLVELEGVDGHLARVVQTIGAESQVAELVVVAGDPPRVVASSRNEWTGHPVAVIRPIALGQMITSTLQSRRERYVPNRREGRVLGAVPIAYEDSGAFRRGAVAVVIDGRVILAQMRPWRLGIAIAVVLMLLAQAAAAELLLRRYVLRPVAAIASAARRRRDGERAPSTSVYADDELGRLAAALDDAYALEQAARRELEHQQFALDQAAMVAVTDVQANLVYVNDTFCKLSGYAREQLLGENPRLLNSGFHPPEFFQEMHDRIRNGGVWRGEIRNRARDGSFYWVHSTIIPSPGEDGKPVRFTAVLFDITALKSAQQALHRNEALTRQVLEGALDAVITMDTGGRITGWNPQAEATFGWRATEVIGRSLAETLIPVQFRAAHARGLERFLQTRQKNIIDQRVELPALHRDGTEFPVEMSISAVHVDTSVMFSAFVRDIRDRRQAEAEIIRGREAAQAASRAKSDFLATMSHEIRTPMNGVIGFTDLLLGTALDQNQREYAEMIRGSGEAMLALINDILDFSKIEAGRLDVDRLPFDARAAAGEVLELLAARAGAQGIELVFDWPAEAPRTLTGDPMRFRQVLMNLAGNAIKFTEHGSVVVRVTAAPDGQVRIAVQDTGIGIESDKLVTLFRKFTQADSSTTRRFGGTGLGLAISKQLVELMGGAIGAESRLGEGSTFWFTLPVAKEAGDEREPQSHDSAAIDGLRVLVVDDFAPNRTILAELLGRAGAEVGTAEDGSAALESMRAAVRAGRPFGAALIDLSLPGLDADALRSAVAADPGLGSPALFLLSGSSSRGEAAELRERGFADVLLKPLVRPELLLQAIARAVACPVARPEAAPPSPAPDPPESPARRRRVLLAEDQPVNQKLALRVLERLGCRVDVANNGVEACERSQRGDYDIVFMDCHMPVMDGFEATLAIRARESASATADGPGPHLPIVALTASVMQSDRDRCFATGMDDFISKPFRPEQIEAALERWASPPGSEAAA